jgi:hypothetical protein
LIGDSPGIIKSPDLTLNGIKFDTISFEELVVEFNPVETKGMEEALHLVHHEQHNCRGYEEHVEPEYHTSDVL